MAYYKQQGGSPDERVTLRSVILKSLQAQSKERAFVDYLARDSDFVDIFIQLLASHLEALPVPLVDQGMAPTS